MTTTHLAWIIISVLLAQFGLWLAWDLYRRKRSAAKGAPAPRTRQAATPAREAGQAWTGLRSFIVQRREYEDGQRSICSFYLVPEDGRPLPDYRPGQFLTFELPIDDPRHPGRAVVRCYSLSDAPHPERYRVTIKRVPAPAEHPELPPGLSSNYFHDRVEAGAHLQVRAPAGHFHLQEAEPLPIVLIGGGIGITPMLSILNTLLGRGSEREIWLFYGLRNGREHIMKAQLQALAEAHRNFHLRVCYSAPDEQDTEGVDYQHRGRVDLALLRASLPLRRHQFYVCGPQPMMESVVPGLEAWGVASEDIHYESFGPATLIKHKQAAEALPAGERPKVSFSRSGKTLPWDPAAGSLLAFAEDNGIEVASGCRAGSCGSCQTGLSAGEVEYLQEPDAEIEAGHCLLCITTPKGDLVLDA